jgi:hypothetical protein
MNCELLPNNADTGLLWVLGGRDFMDGGHRSLLAFSPSPAEILMV